MESLGNSVPSEDLTFPESSMESKFWSRSVGPSTVYNMKSEGSYTNNSSDGSCLPSWIQAMEQSGKYNQPFPSACDSTELERIDQAKCGFSAITSGQCNQYSKPMDNILEDSSLGLSIRTLESQFDRWQFPYAGWDHEAGQEEFKSPLSAHRKAVGEGLFHSEISDDSSLDGGVPAGSSLSSGSNSLVTVEDEVCVNATSTSVELHSLSNIALSSPRLLPRPNIALSSTCSEGSTQVRSCGLDSSFPELGSRVLDQTLPSGADVDHNSLAAKLQLGNEGTIVLVQPQSPDLKQQTDGQQTLSSMKVKRKHEVQALDGNESSWGTKRLKLSSPSPPTTPAGLPVPFPAVNFTGGNGINANPPVAPPPFLVRNSTTPDVYQVPALSSLGSAASLTKPSYMSPPQFMYAASFTDVNDSKEIENSRPKRRNVKISTDPQSVAARLRREKISNRMRKLQTLVPGGMKMDTASMLDEAISFVKYLQQQLRHQYTLECLPKAGFYPRMQFSDVCPSDRFPDISRYYMPARPVQGDCSTVLQIAPGESPEHGMYGASAGQSAMKFPDVNREQFCH